MRLIKINKNEKVKGEHLAVILTHNDMDGICSAGIMASLERIKDSDFRTIPSLIYAVVDGAPNQAVSNQMLDNVTYDMNKNYHTTFETVSIYITDRDSPSVEALKVFIETLQNNTCNTLQFEIVVCDHHVSNEKHHKELLEGIVEKCPDLDITTRMNFNTDISATKIVFNTYEIYLKQNLSKIDLDHVKDITTLVDAWDTFKWVKYDDIEDIYKVWSIKALETYTDIISEVYHLLAECEFYDMYSLIEDAYGDPLDKLIKKIGVDMWKAKQNMEIDRETNTVFTTGIPYDTLSLVCWKLFNEFSKGKDELYGDLSDIETIISVDYNSGICNIRQSEYKDTIPTANTIAEAMGIRFTTQGGGHPKAAGFTIYPKGCSPLKSITRIPRIDDFIEVIKVLKESE